jgi:predicted membrane-bound mannosyltransferase
MEPRQLSWRRVTAGSVALFAIVLAFLAGRVKSGADPTQAKAAAPAAVTAPAQPQPQAPADPGFDPSQSQQDQVVPQQQPAPLTTQQS